MTLESSAPAITWPASMPQDRRDAVLRSQKFKAYLERAQDSFDFRGGRVHHVVWFDRNKTKVGMILFEADALTRDGDSFPGTYTLIRGDSVAVLPVLRTPDGAAWTVVIKQPRIAAGDPELEEIPAGMVDEGVFVSAAVRELEEEVGEDLRIREGDLQHIRTFYPSPGGCDEKIAVYWAEKAIGYDLLASLRGRQAGAIEEGERIRVDIIPLDELAVRASMDAKAIVAYYGYMAQHGLVAAPGPTSADPGPDGPAP